MLAFGDLIRLQGILLLLMCCGVVLNRIGVLDGIGRSRMTDLMIDLILPCNIVHAFMIRMNRDILLETVQVLLIATVVQIASWAVGKIAFRAYARPRAEVMRYGTMCSNSGFMGNPIVEGIFGSGGLLYASVYLIPLRFFMWTAGIACFTDMKWKEAVRKLAVHPCIIAVWIGFAVMAGGGTLPPVISETVGYLSACTLPVALLIIGSILAEVSPHALFDRGLLWFCVIRLLLLPAGVLLLCLLLRESMLVTGVSVVLTCMPAGSTTAILAEKYGGDAVYGSKLVLASTILSLVSIPLFCKIIAVIYAAG